MWKYIRASTALAGIFSRVLDDGGILVDSISMDNLTVEVIRGLSERGPVIAVDGSRANRDRAARSVVARAADRLSDRPRRFTTGHD